jgi:hypothetical protein
MKTPSYSEAIYMAKIKREKAKAALAAVIERYGVISNEPQPGLDVLLDYYNNMVYGLELLLKVLSKDWDAAGQSRFRHDVGKMYLEIFKRCYTKSDLMDLLKQAILDQKYIYEPGDKLLDRVPELEELWDELKMEFYQRNFGSKEALVKEVTMGSDFAQYLVANVARFYTPKWITLNPHSKEQRIQMLEMHRAFLQKEIERLQGSQETVEQEHERIVQQARQEYEDKLKSLANMMRMNFHFQGSDQLTFGTWNMTAVVTDFLG